MGAKFIFQKDFEGEKMYGMVGRQIWNTEY